MYCSTTYSVLWSLKVQITLPETNIAPENWPSQKETSLPTISRFYISFREGKRHLSSRLTSYDFPRETLIRHQRLCWFQESVSQDWTCINLFRGACKCWIRLIMCFFQIDWVEWNDQLDRQLVIFQHSSGFSFKQLPKKGHAMITPSNPEIHVTYSTYVPYFCISKFVWIIL